MTTKPPMTNSLNITKDDVMKVIKRIIKVDGLEAARSAFQNMNDYFSSIQGWAETTDELYDLFAEKRKEEKQQQREEKLEEQRAAASKFVVVSKATSDAKTIGTAEIDKMDVDVKSPGNTIAKTIKFGKNNDDEN